MNVVLLSLIPLLSISSDVLLDDGKNTMGCQNDDTCTWFDGCDWSPSTPFLIKFIYWNFDPIENCCDCIPPLVVPKVSVPTWTSVGQGLCVNENGGSPRIFLGFQDSLKDCQQTCEDVYDNNLCYGISWEQKKHACVLYTWYEKDIDNFRNLHYSFNFEKDDVLKSVVQASRNSNDIVDCYALSHLEKDAEPIRNDVTLHGPFDDVAIDDVDLFQTECNMKVFSISLDVRCVDVKLDEMAVTLESFSQDALRDVQNVIGNNGLTLETFGTFTIAEPVKPTPCPIVEPCPEDMVESSSTDEEGCLVVSCKAAEPVKPNPCPIIQPCPEGMVESSSSDKDGCLVISCKAEKGHRLLKELEARETLEHF